MCSWVMNNQRKTPTLKSNSTIQESTLSRSSMTLKNDSCKPLLQYRKTIMKHGKALCKRLNCSKLTSWSHFSTILSRRNSVETQDPLWYVFCLIQVSYDNYPYLLLEEIENRRAKKKRFDETELWLLLYCLLDAQK